MIFSSDLLSQAIASKSSVGRSNAERRAGRDQCRSDHRERAAHDRNGHWPCSRPCPASNDVLNDMYTPSMLGSAAIAIGQHDSGSNHSRY